MKMPKSIAVFILHFSFLIILLLPLHAEFKVVSYIFNFLFLTLMKLLLLGSGGREHALAWKIAQSPKIDKLYIAPGNAGTANEGENVNLKADDFAGIKQFVLEKGIDKTALPAADAPGPLLGLYVENRMEKPIRHKGLWK